MLVKFVLTYLFSLLYCIECGYVGGPAYYRAQPYPSSFAQHPGYYAPPKLGPANYHPYQSPLYGPSATFYNQNNQNLYPFPGGGTPVFVYYHKRCDGNYVGLQPLPDQRQYYYVCNPDCVIFGKCGNLQTFDSNSEKCITFPQSDSIFVCEREGRFPILADCNLYYKCDCTLTPKIYSCPRGKVFNATVSDCVLGYECRPTQINSHGSYIPENCEEKFPPCQAEGVFRSPKDCSLYYNCTLPDNQSFLQTRFKCPDDNFYDIGKQLCLPRNQVACDCVQIAECVYPRTTYQSYYLPAQQPYPALSHTKYPIEEAESSPEYHPISSESVDEPNDSDETPFSTEIISPTIQTISTSTSMQPISPQQPTFSTSTSSIPTSEASSSIQRTTTSPSITSSTAHETTEADPSNSIVTSEPINPSITASTSTDEPTDYPTDEIEETAVPFLQEAKETGILKFNDDADIAGETEFENPSTTTTTDDTTNMITPTVKPTYTNSPFNTFFDPEAIRDLRSTVTITENTDGPAGFEDENFSKLSAVSSTTHTPIQSPTITTPISATPLNTTTQSSISEQEEHFKVENPITIASSPSSSVPTELFNNDVQIDDNKFDNEDEDDITRNPTHQKPINILKSPTPLSEESESYEDYSDETSKHSQATRTSSLDVTHAPIMFTEATTNKTSTDSSPKNVINIDDEPQVLADVIDFESGKPSTAPPITTAASQEKIIESENIRENEKNVVESTSVNPTNANQIISAVKPVQTPTITPSTTTQLESSEEVIESYEDGSIEASTISFTKPDASSMVLPVGFTHSPTPSTTLIEEVVTDSTISKISTTTSIPIGSTTAFELKDDDEAQVLSDLINLDSINTEKLTNDHKTPLNQDVENTASKETVVEVENNFTEPTLTTSINTTPRIPTLKTEPITSTNPPKTSQSNEHNVASTRNPIIQGSSTILSVESPTMTPIPADSLTKIELSDLDEAQVLSDVIDLDNGNTEKSIVDHNTMVISSEKKIIETTSSIPINTVATASIIPSTTPQAESSLEDLESYEDNSIEASTISSTKLTEPLMVSPVESTQAPTDSTSTKMLTTTPVPIGSFTEVNLSDEDETQVLSDVIDLESASTSPKTTEISDEGITERQEISKDADSFVETSPTTSTSIVVSTTTPIPSTTPQVETSEEDSIEVSTASPKSESQSTALPVESTHAPISSTSSIKEAATDTVVKKVITTTPIPIGSLTKDELNNEDDIEVLSNMIELDASNTEESNAEHSTTSTSTKILETTNEDEAESKGTSEFNVTPTTPTTKPEQITFANPLTTAVEELTDEYFESYEDKSFETITESQLTGLPIETTHSPTPSTILTEEVVNDQSVSKVTTTTPTPIEETSTLQTVHITSAIPLTTPQVEPSKAEITSDEDSSIQAITVSSIKPNQQTTITPKDISSTPHIKEVVSTTTPLCIDCLIQGELGDNDEAQVLSDMIDLGTGNTDKSIGDDKTTSGPLKTTRKTEENETENNFDEASPSPTIHITSTISSTTPRRESSKEEITSDEDSSIQASIVSSIKPNKPTTISPVDISSTPPLKEIVRTTTPLFIQGELNDNDEAQVLNDMIDLRTDNTEKSIVDDKTTSSSPKTTVTSEEKETENNFDEASPLPTIHITSTIPSTTPRKKTFEDSYEDYSSENNAMNTASPITEGSPTFSPTPVPPNSKLFVRSTATTTEVSIAPSELTTAKGNLSEEELDNSIDYSDDASPKSTPMPITISPTTQPSTAFSTTESITEIPTQSHTTTTQISTNTTTTTTTPKPCTTRTLIAHLQGQDLEISVHNGTVQIRSDSLVSPVNNNSSNFTASETDCHTSSKPRLEMKIRDDFDLLIEFCKPDCEEEHKHNFESKDPVVDMVWHPNNSHKTLRLESAN